MSLYNSYRNYIRKKFGKPVLKIPINGGFSCPNRDGTKSTTGCHFCDNISFSPAAQCGLPPVEQLRSVIDKVSRFDLFIPYLQPFSNTYGSVDLLKSVYEPLLVFPGVVGLAVGTRPDCFTDEVFDYLGELSRRTYLSVEIGLQSSHDSTLELLNRHHYYSDFTVAVERLANLGIEVVAHVMLGLPGETSEMMEQTADRLASIQVCGVKIHQLMVIRNTRFQSWYENGTYTPLSVESYAELLGNFLSRLRPDQHIHRIMADSKPEYGLVAPQWSGHKNSAVNFIHEQLKKNGIAQGMQYKTV